MENLENKNNSESDILQKINLALSEFVPNEEYAYIKAPEFLPEYEILKGKRVTMVDDVPGIMINNLPEYIVATNGNANSVLHKEQSQEELVAEIMGKNPDIVLMDYHLAKGIIGINVIRRLREEGYSGKVAGFSSEGRSEEFKEAGAIGCVKKIANQSESALNLAELLNSQK